MRKHRISNNSIEYIALTEPGRVWLPDLFFRNEKKGRFHKIILPNVLLRIYPNGRVTYSVRISLILFCPMQLHFFPLDIQTCTINMTSCEYIDHHWIQFVTTIQLIYTHISMNYSFRWIYWQRYSFQLEERPTKQSSPTSTQTLSTQIQFNKIQYSSMWCENKYR